MYPDEEVCGKPISEFLPPEVINELTPSMNKTITDVRISSQKN